MSDAISRPADDWYLPLARHLKGAYLRYSFTKGTDQEVDFLCDLLALTQGKRLLDVGCGPGRHAIAFAERGIETVGVDLSADFLNVAKDSAKGRGLPVSFFEIDAKDLPFDSEFDAAISICEGAFGLGLDDLSILRGMKKALRPGARLAVSAVNVFYVLAHMKDKGTLDINQMLFAETAEVIGAEGETEKFDMWSSCFTPRELEWIANGAGLDPLTVYGATPGNFKQAAPTDDDPELLLIAERPGKGTPA